MDITCIFNGALTLIEAFDFPFFPIYPLSFEQSFLFLIALIICYFPFIELVF